MSTGSRHLNYTKRKRITREHVAVTLQPSDGEDRPSFDAALTLDSYGLPVAARVFVEAYRQTVYQRFAYGTAGAVTPPENRSLHADFGSGEGVQFRIKVVEPASADAGAARILAHADRLSPDQVGKRRSLLPIDPWDSRDEVWRLHFDETTGPLLRVSKYLMPDRHELANSKAFLTLCLPEILRRVLERAFKDGVPDQEEDRDTWEAKWVRAGCSIANIKPPEENEDTSDWIDAVVAKFCRKHKIAAKFSKWRTDGARP